MNILFNIIDMTVISDYMECELHILRARFKWKNSLQLEGNEGIKYHILDFDMR